MKNMKKSKWTIFFMVFFFLRGSILLLGDQIYRLESARYRIETAKDGFHRISMEGYHSYGIPGCPDLPSKIFRVALPPNIDFQSVRIDYDDSLKSYIGNYRLKELPPLATWMDDQIIFGPKADVYSKNEYFPPNPVEILGISEMRKWKILNIKYTPFQYNPVTGELWYIPEAAVRVKYNRVGFESVPNGVLADQVMDKRAEKILFNFSESKEWYAPSGIVPRPSQSHDYVIITTNSIVASSTQLNNFSHYLTSKGFSPLIITEDDYGSLTGQTPNGTAEKIREWLKNNYIGYSIEYVLLIGNPDPDDPSTVYDSVGDVPMKMCWPRYGEANYRESPTDYFYADLTGDWDLDGDGYFGEYDGDRGLGGVDFLNEVYVGRIPVYSGVADLDSVLSKIIDYGNTSAGGITWRQSAMLPMSYSDSITDGAYLAEAMKSNYLSPAGFSSWTLYMQGGLCAAANSSFASNEELVDGATRNRWMSDTFGMVWWWGHGSATGASLGYTGCGWGTILSTTDTSSLNDNYPAFVYQCSCNNGYPEASSNLGTALLYSGAITTVSASRVSWYAVTTWYTGLKYYCDNASIGYYYGRDLVSSSKKAGAAFYDVKADMGLHGGYWGGESWMNLFDFNLYGDPAISLSEHSSIHSVTTPDAPSGPAQGLINVSYVYSTAGSLCSFGHSVEYRFDWDDGTYSDWSSSTQASHSWSSQNTHSIKVQARCSVDPAILSGWSSGTTVSIYISLPPSTPSNPSPSDGSTQVDIDTNLDWDDCTGATSYDIYFGTASPPSLYANTAVSHYDLPQLEYDTSYHWRVVAKNTSGDASGPEWQFRTQPRLTSPSNYKVLPEALWAPASGGGTWVTEAQITDLTGGSQVSVYFNYGGGGRRGPFLLWTGPGPDSSVKFANLLSAVDALDSEAFSYYGKLGSIEFVTQDTNHKIHVASRIVNGNYSKTSPGLNALEADTADVTRQMMVQNMTNNASYRSTIGCFNLSSDTVFVEFRLIDGNGNQIGMTFTRIFLGYDFQAFSPFAEAGRPYPDYSYDNVFVRVKPVSGSGKVMCFGASANNTTNDPAAHLAVQALTDQVNSPSNHKVLPEALWAPASGGGTWVTEAQITDLTGGSQVSVYFNYGGGGRRGPFLLWTGPGPDNSVKLANLLSAMDALDSEAFSYYGKLGSIEFVTQDTDHKIHVASRIVNGNYSKTSPGLNALEANTADVTRQMMVQNMTNNAAYRATIGCFNLSSDTVLVEFRLIDGNGNQIGTTFTRTFAGYDFQAFSPFAEAGRPYPDYSYDNVFVRIKPVSGSGKVMCFGASANNTTNDPAAHLAVLND
jgi:hypothetical protein